MKSPESALRIALLTDPAVALALGTKVYPLLAPKTVSLPLVTYRRSNITREHTLSSPMGTPTVSVEVSCYAATYEDAREVADVVRRRLDGYGATVDNVEVKNVSLESEADDFVQLAGNDLPPVYQVTQTYNVLWQEL